MKISNTTWQTISEKDTRSGGIVFGYEAPATADLLKKFHEHHIVFEVVETTPQPHFVRMVNSDGSDKQIFTSDQKLRIMDQNKTFQSFEDQLSTDCGGHLPENRFDEFVNWTNPDVYSKTANGYSLSLSGLSDDKRTELRENLADLSPAFQGDKILISGQKNIESLQFTWKMAQEQGGLKRLFRKPNPQPTPKKFKKPSRDY